MPAPSSARRRTMPAPMPREPPTTSAILSFRGCSVFVMGMLRSRMNGQKMGEKHGILRPCPGGLAARQRREREPCRCLQRFQLDSGARTGLKALHEGADKTHRLGDVYLWRNVALLFGQGNRFSQCAHKHRARLFAQLHHIGIIAAEFGNGANAHAALVAQCLVWGSEACQHGLYAGKGSFARTQTPDMRSDALLLVLSKRFKVERPLVAKAVVHALAPDLHRLDQVAGRGGGKTLRPEDGHCPLQHFVAIEFSWPHHGRHLNSLWTDVSIIIGL